jgi:TusA-related sulfurtransferase
LKIEANSICIKPGTQIALGLSHEISGSQLNDTSTHNLDLRNSIHPIALLMAKRAIRDIAPGEMLVLLIGDPETRVDLFKVLSDIAYEVLRQEEIEGEDAFYRIWIRKKKPSTRMRRFPRNNNEKNR